MLHPTRRTKVLALLMLTMFLLTTAATTALACTQGDENRAIALAKREVDVDRDTHIFVAVPQSEDCDDWVVQKRTPGIRGEIACIITIVDWVVVDVTCCPTGC